MNGLLKKQYKKIRRFIRQYVNGAKGFLSIFLALTVSPLLLCTFMFIEYARFQSINELMQEIMGSSLFSTLGSYDSYLEERFDLLAVAQDVDINSLYNNYATQNTNSLGKAVSLTGTQAQGQHDFGKGDILKQQLYEASEKPVLTQALWDGLNIDSLIEKLGEVKQVKQLSAMADVADKATQFGDDATKMIKAGLDSYDKSTTYTANFDKYDVAAENFRAALAAVDAAKSSGGSALAAAEQNAEAAAKQYAEASQELNDSLGELSEKIGELLESSGKLAEDLFQVQDSISKYKQAGASEGAESVGADAYGWFNMMYGMVEDFRKTNVSESYQSQVNAEQAKFRTQTESLRTFVAAGQGASAMLSDPYKPVQVSSFKRNIAEQLLDLKNRLNHSATDDNEGIQEIKDFADLAKDILDLKVLYDGNLNSQLDTSVLVHTDSFDTSGLLTASSLAGIIDDSVEFLDGIKNANVFKAITKLVSFLVNLTTFLVGVIAWIAEHFVNLVRFLAQPKEYYHAFLLYGYAAYNLPNRTTYMEGSTLTDYEFKKIFNLAGGNYSAETTGSLKDVVNIQDSSGSDPMLKGAELEYMLTGANSEYAAQAGAFFDGYMFRLASDSVAVVRSDILQALSVTGPGRIAATIIFLIIEPLLDMIVLVNGGKEPLFKEVAYLSSRGLIYLGKDLWNCTNISDRMKEQVNGQFKREVDGINAEIDKKEEERAKNSTGKDLVKHGSQGSTAEEKMKEENGYFLMDYTGHGAILQILCTPLEDYSKRIQNIIQMEAKEYYKEKSSFSIDKAYTSIHSNTEYHLKPFMGLSPSLTGGFPMKKERDLAY